MNVTKKALISSVLALFLCFAMLVGTTYAWFTDSVASKGNIITAGTLDVTMEWAEGNTDPDTVTWIDASTGAMFDNDLWEPGYVEAKHIKITNTGSLALKYKLRLVADTMVSKLANVIDVYYFDTATQLTRADVENGTCLGTLAEVLGSGEESAKALYRTVNGALESGELTTLTLALKMQESAGNEYQGLELGTFSVELIAAQYSFEVDSFDDQYDAKVPDEELPYAFVTPLEKEQLAVNATINDFGTNAVAESVTMDAAYQFEPTIFNENPDGNSVYDDVDSSKYKQYHADFYVYADKDIASGTIGLVGYYGTFCEDWNNGNWVSLEYDDGGYIAAGNGVRLLNDGMGISCITYKNICQWGNDGIGFRCGLYDIDGALAGTTITVELRLYESTVDWTNSSHGDCEGETGEYLTVGKFTYTFAEEVATADELKAAIANGVKGVRLTDDIAIANNETITLAAGKELVVDLNGYTLSATADKTGNQEAFLVKGNMTVKNGSVEMVAANNQGWNAMATIFDVTAGGALTLDGVTANVSGTDMNFVAHLNNWGSATLTVTNCDFTSTYVAIRVFNSGNDMNTVTVENTAFHGGRVFWVHNYTAEGKDDSTLTLDIYGNGNTTDNENPVRFGFNNSVFFDINGNEIV